MEEIDKKMKLKKIFFKKIGDGLHHTTPVGVYPRPSLFFQRCQAWPPFLRNFKRTNKKNYTLHHIYIRVRTRAREGSTVKNENKKKRPSL